MNTIEHDIPKTISNLINCEVENGHCSFAILSIEGTGNTKYYPSIKDGKELTFSDTDYFKNKVERERLTVRLVISGNAVSAENYIKEKTGLNASAIDACLVDVYI
jgi:hypothetical protein